ncbi:lantibiotic dehydratase [Streptomyces abikoensis]|uniref:Lantibiotic dehydratase n=1 Tax=Streptomyces abikoensis TaxID=97398 RepID=A0ABW7T4U7_9ACTN
MFRSASTALLRAAIHSSLPEIPPLPDLDSARPGHTAALVSWLRRVWAQEDIVEAVGYASPALAEQVRRICTGGAPAARDARRAVVSVARYLQRAVGRAAPLGTFAGVATVGFGREMRQHWGNAHGVVARAGAEWLHEVIVRLEECPELLARLPVVVNSTVVERGDRLIVPYQPQVREGGVGAVEVSVRYTPAVRAVTSAAREPTRVDDLAAKVRAEYPTVPAEQVVALLTQLVTQGVLITSLRAPGTEADALGHLVEQLKAADVSMVTSVADIAAELSEIHREVERHNQAPVDQRRAMRERVAERMRGVARPRKHPLALDVRLDAALDLPEGVAREVERAAWALTVLSAYPTGVPSWRSYHQRFYEHFGIGSLVPVMDVVGDSGIGWPDGYPATARPEQPSPLSGRDKELLALAQRAALDGEHEVVLDEQKIAALRLGPIALRPPSHLEIGVRVYARDEDALAQGDFRLEVVAVSRAAGVLTGRFLGVLEEDGRAALTEGLAGLPGADDDTTAAQLSHPPFDPATAHVTRSVRVLPTLISLAEHRPPGDGALTVADLGVGCDGRRMYLAAPALGRRLEAAGMHALNLRTHTPPLARFLTELSRANCAQVTRFNWGAASHLPFLPRLRYGRTILSPARWHLEQAELPTKEESSAAWAEALDAWRSRRQAPRRVHLVEDDRLLPLDLDDVGHRMLLRAHLDTSVHAVLTEAPEPTDLGWCGGRAHEVIVPLTITKAPAWPPLPRPTRARVVGRDRGYAPAVSPVLLAVLYGDINRQDVVLAEHLPELIERLGGPPWWFMRYRDPEQHLRLRIALPGPDAFGAVARMVSAWAGELHQQGLLRTVRYETSYPETGRWGSGMAWDAVEAVFRADSAAVLATLTQRTRPQWQTLVAAHSVAIASAFTGSTDAGMQWLIDHIPATAPQRTPRPVFQEAVRLADPSENWAALRTVPGGAAIVDAWAPRDVALSAYRAHLPGPDTEGIAVDDVLGSLLHVNVVRQYQIDFPAEAVGLYLARSAAMAWTARTRGGQP